MPFHHHFFPLWVWLKPLASRLRLVISHLLPGARRVVFVATHVSHAQDLYLFPRSGLFYLLPRTSLVSCHLPSDLLPFALMHASVAAHRSLAFHLSLAFCFSLRKFLLPLNSCPFPLAAQRANTLCNNHRVVFLSRTCRKPSRTSLARTPWRTSCQSILPRSQG